MNSSSYFMNTLFSKYQPGEGFYPSGYELPSCAFSKTPKSAYNSGNIGGSMNGVSNHHQQTPGYFTPPTSSSAYHGSYDPHSTTTPNNMYGTLNQSAASPITSWDARLASYGTSWPGNTAELDSSYNLKEHTGGMGVFSPSAQSDVLNNNCHNSMVSGGNPNFPWMNVSGRFFYNYEINICFDLQLYRPFMFVLIITRYKCKLKYRPSSITIEM